MDFFDFIRQAKAPERVVLPLILRGVDHRDGVGDPARREAEGQAGPILLLAEGHGTNEIYSERLNGWVWMDLTFRILGVYFKEDGPITMAELYNHLNDPNRVQSLRLMVYDPKTRTAKLASLMESGQKDGMFNYFKRDQQFHYLRWDRE